MGTSVDNELVLWSGTTGTVLKRGTGSGVVRVASGVAQVGQGSALPWSSGRYYDSSASLPTSAWATGGSMSALRLYATPLFVPNDVTISEVGVYVVAGQTSALGRVGLYACGADWRPGALVWQGGSTLDFSSGPAVKSLTGLSLALTGGTWYWTAVVSDTAAVTIHESSSQTSGATGYTSHSDTARERPFKTLASLVLPDPFGTPTGNIGGYSRVSFKVA